MSKSVVKPEAVEATLARAYATKGAPTPAKAAAPVASPAPAATPRPAARPAAVPAPAPAAAPGLFARIAERLRAAYPKAP